MFKAVGASGSGPGVQKWYDKRLAHVDPASAAPKLQFRLMDVLGR